MITSLQIRHGVQSHKDNDGSVIFDADRGTYFSLNGVATEIWSQLEEGHPLAEIESHLCRVYLMGPETVKPGFAAFVAELQERQLVHALD